MAIKENDIYQELEERYPSKPHRKKNSFYVDGREIEKPPGSANVLGDFSKCMYNLSGSKIIRTEI